MSFIIRGCDKEGYELIQIYINKEVIWMVIIKAKVMDSMHLELEKGIETSEKEVFVKIIKRGIVESAEGAWGYDVDSKEFVKDLRKSTRLDWI